MRRFASLVLGLLLTSLLAAAPARADAPSFSNWAAVVVAGDWHAHSGGPTEAFDNARRDVSATLLDFGFSPDAIRQYSMRPKRYPAVKPRKTELGAIHADLRDLAAKHASGCLVYLTSHGAPEGALLGKDLLPPGLLAAMIDDACPDRPSIVVVSACFSGVFVKPLQREDRMILTAARPDRTSFGCSEDDKYPYFDDCFLSSMPGAHDFSGLATTVRECVRRRELAERVSPPSEPQIWVGGELRPMLPLLAFQAGAPAAQP